MPVMLKLFFLFILSWKIKPQCSCPLFQNDMWISAQKKDRHVRVIGQDAFDSLQYFYTAVKSVFEKGLTGGCRIIATKPALN